MSDRSQEERERASVGETKRGTSINGRDMRENIAHGLELSG
jgi:hypothetical protein